jgi:hypothetical protein
MLAALVCAGGDEAPAELQREKRGGQRNFSTGRKETEQYDSIMVNVKHITAKQQWHLS